MARKRSPGPRVRKPADKFDGATIRKASSLWRLWSQLLLGQDGVRPAFNLENFQAALSESVFLYAACYRVAQALANTAPRIVVTDTGENAPESDATRFIRRVLRRPSQDWSGFDLMEASFVHLGVDGEMLIEKARDRLGVTRELYVLNPDWTHPVPDPTGRRLVLSYKVRVGGAVVTLGPDDVIAARQYNPRMPYRGLSPVSSVRREVRGDIQAAEFNSALLRNGLKLGGILKPTEGDPGEDAWQAILAQIAERNQGEQKAGSIMPLEWGFDFVPDATTPRDAEYLAGRKFAREAMSASMGAPPMLVQNYDAASYANSEQQLRAFWDYCGKPLLTKFFEAFNRAWIWPEVSDALALVPDLVGIDAQIDSEKSRVDNAGNLLQRGIITLNEARRRVGYPPLPDGDKLLVQGANVVLDPENLETPEATPADRTTPVDSAAQQDAADPSPDAPAEGKALAAADRAVIQLAHEKSVRIAEARFRHAVETVLGRQRASIVARAKASGRNATADELMPSVEAEARWMYAALLPTWLAVLRDSGTKTIRRLGGVQLRSDGEWFVEKAKKPVVRVAGTFDMGNPRVARVLEEHFFSHLRDDVNATTKGHLEDLVAEFKASASEGEGVSELVSRIEGMEAFGGSRAESIARTETIGAVNLGAIEAFRATDTPAKSWLSERGPNVRESHKAADDETSSSPIAIDAPFELSEEGRGSASLQYPGDPAAPGWAVINCRCAVVPEETIVRRAFSAACKAEMLHTV